MDDSLAALAEDLQDASVAAAFTGAGVSTASGIPDFRGEDGIWNDQFDPADFHLSRFERDPAGFWQDRLELHEVMRPDGVAPNPAHDALARLEAEDVVDGVITQNTDGLHTQAGSQHVIELHGNAGRVVCRRCGRRWDAESARRRAREGELPPTCEDCGGVLKPDVVLFGEQLPLDVFGEARTLARESDVFLVAGSSLEVDPAASLPGTAAEDGVVAIINLDSTPYSDAATYDIRADVTVALPRLAELILS